jgi:predicted N-acetyltransferase YhbS
MQIRKFSNEDAHQCAAIIDENKENMGDIYDAEGLKKASTYTAYFVSEENGQINGLIGFTDLNNGIGMLGTLCVSKSSQGKGVGRALVLETIKYATSQKYRKVLMLTHEMNKPMMVLAIKEGFIPEGSLRKHFRDGKDVIYLSYFIQD